MFERSQSGQSNRAVFMNVDFICYVEGGGGRQDASSPDLSFWKSILKLFRPAIKIKFVPRGGKPILEALAKDVLSKDVNNTLVAMDADYDEIFCEKIDDRRILYTYGYSWENDVYSAGNISRIYCCIAHCEETGDQVQQFVDLQFEKLRRALRHPVRADCVALASKSSILPRKQPGRIIKPMGNHGGPQVDAKEILSITKHVNRSTKSHRSTSIPRIDDTLRYCVGHVLALSVYYLVKAAVRSTGKSTNLTPDHVRDISIQTFTDLLRDDSNHIISLYYNKQCSLI